MATRITFKPEGCIRQDVLPIRKKTSLALVVFLSILCTSKAQDHVHDDSLVVLRKQSFVINVLQSSDSILHIEILNNLADSITPFFVEFSINGFLFKQECILEQRINNMPIEKNIERIWGPQFVALGIGKIPANGNFQTKLGTFNGSHNSLESTIQVRIFGMVNGHNVIWNGNLKN